MVMLELVVIAMMLVFPNLQHFQYTNLVAIIQFQGLIRNVPLMQVVWNVAHMVLVAMLQHLKVDLLICRVLVDDVQVAMVEGRRLNRCCLHRGRTAMTRHGANGSVGDSW